MTKITNEKLAKKCARCFRQRKKCDHEKGLSKKCLNCMKYKKEKKACLIQCKECYKKNKDVKEGPFPQCKNCKEITKDSPDELIEENGKIYFIPGNGKQYEINE
ncbi:1223_t:CDS:2, partial [Gigaspora rosea]